VKDTTSIELPPPTRKSSDLDGRIVKDRVKKTLLERQSALSDLVDAIRSYGKLAESRPLTLQGSEYVHEVQELNKAVDRAEGMLVL
jgi:hypothetical protein